jgi:CheY-like chemotaxis protein
MIKFNILLVEDESGDIFLFKDAINNIKQELDNKDIVIKFNIETKDNGMDALSYITEENPKIDLVFLDINMPKMGGLTLLEELGKKEVEVPIVMFTTSTYEDDIKKALISNAIMGYVIKEPDPFVLEEVLKSIIMLCTQGAFIYVNFTNIKYDTIIKNLGNS